MACNPIEKGASSPTNYEPGKPLGCFEIEPNQPFVTCKQKEGDCTKTNASKTLRPRQGEWKFDQTNETSSFASPDFNTCADISK
ncbi:MAG: hypothetical protein AB8A40_08495, partial [Prochlorococcus sp.]